VLYFLRDKRIRFRDGFLTSSGARPRSARCGHSTRSVCQLMMSQRVGDGIGRVAGFLVPINQASGTTDADDSVTSFFLKSGRDVPNMSASSTNSVSAAENATVGSGIWKVDHDENQPTNHRRAGRGVEEEARFL